MSQEQESKELSELDDQTYNQLQRYATELAEDYTGYLKIDCVQESRKLQERIDDYLGILEGFCGALESIRQDSTICLEEHLPSVIDKSRQVHKLYEDIDRIEAVVGTVKKTVDDVEFKVSEAESVLGKPVIIRRLFNTLFGSSPKKTNRINATPTQQQYIEPYIFKSSNYFIESNDPVHSLDAASPDGGSASDDPDEEIVVRSQRNTKKNTADATNK